MLATQLIRVLATFLVLNYCNYIYDCILIKIIIALLKQEIYWWPKTCTVLYVVSF